jgi:hypothetical protein
MTILFSNGMPKTLKQEDNLVFAKFFCNKMKKLTPKLSNVLEKLRAPNGCSALFVNNFPKLCNEEKQIKIAELMSLAFALLIAQPFQYTQQNDGRLVDRINPKWSEPISLISINQHGFYEVGVPTYNVRTVDSHDIEAQTAFQYFLKIIDFSKKVFRYQMIPC